MHLFTYEYAISIVPGTERPIVDPISESDYWANSPFDPSTLFIHYQKSFPSNDHPLWKVNIAHLSWVS